MKETEGIAKRKTRTRAAKKAQQNSDRVAVLQTHVNFPLIIRSNPSEEQVRSFVEEHNRRYHAGEPGGPGGQPAFLIQSGMWFDSEADYEANPSGGVPIDL